MTEQHHRLFRKAVESAGHSIYFTDRDGTIEYVNPAFEETTGYTAEEAVGQEPNLLKSGVHEDAFYRELWETVLDGDVWEDTLVNQRKDGEEYVVRQTIAPVEGDAGDIEYFVAINAEITDEITQQRELERYQTMVEASGDPVYTLDADGRFTYVDDALVEMTGFDRDALLGEPASKVMSQEDVERGEELIRSLLSSGADRGTFEMDLHTATGERVHCENHVALLPFDDDFRGTVGVVRDISTRVEQQRRLERERDRLDEFAGVVSHDLRSPLNVALGRIHNAIEDDDTDQLDAAYEALLRMDDLIDDVLALARAGATIGETDRVELAALVDACWATVATASADLTIETERTLRADISRLKQLLENLLRNAVTHGGEQVTITVGDLSNGFYVEDDGPGIPEAKREAVFEASYSSSSQNTGLGLSIAEKVVEAHGWQIRVTDGASGGARFEVTGLEPE